MKIVLSKRYTFKTLRARADRLEAKIVRGRRPGVAL